MTSSNLLLTQSKPPSWPSLITSHRFHLQIPSWDELQLPPVNVGEHKPSLHGRVDDQWWHGQPYAGEGRRERNPKLEDKRNDGLACRVKYVRKRKTNNIYSRIYVESKNIVQLNLFAGQEQRYRHREWTGGHSRGMRGGDKLRKKY